MTSYAKVCEGGARLHPQRGATGGAEMTLREGISLTSQRNGRAPSASPRYFPRVQTPLIEGGLLYVHPIFCTPRRGKVGGKCAISRRAPWAPCTVVLH